MTEYTGTTSIGVPAWRFAGQSHMKGDAARQKFIAKSKATSQKQYNEAVYKGGAVALKPMIEAGLTVCSDDGVVRIAKLTAEQVGKHSARGIERSDAKDESAQYYAVTTTGILGASATARGG